TPGPGVRRLAATYMARGQASSLQTCWRENRGFLAHFRRFFRAQSLALRLSFLYKRGLDRHSARPLWCLAVRTPDHSTRTPIPRGYDNGRSEKKNLAVAPWHAPLGGCAEEADLCRGQGLRRAPPPAPSRPQDRHVQGPAGPEEERVLRPDESRVGRSDL